MKTYSPQLTKNKKPSATSNATFHRLRRKVDQLRDQIGDLTKQFHRALGVYHSELKPIKKKAGELVSRFLLKIREVTQEPGALGKRQHEIIKPTLADSLNLVFQLLPQDEVHEEIHSFYKQIIGHSFHDEFRTEMADVKKMLAEETGLAESDIPDLEPNESFEQFLRKFAHTFKEKISRHEDVPPPPPRQKNKKEMLKEQKALELEALQNKGLSSIYKRLVKQLHPDLETDPVQKVEKDQLMKRLTTAYEDNDLVSLLAIESEWLGHMDATSHSLNQETIKVYNSLMKDQIEEMKIELEMIYIHPRYTEITLYTQDYPKAPLKGMQEALKKFDSIIKKFTRMLKDLSGKNPLESLKEIIKLIEMNSLVEDDFEGDDYFDCDDFMEELQQLFQQGSSKKPRIKK